MSSPFCQTGCRRISSVLEIKHANPWIKCSAKLEFMSFWAPLNTKILYYIILSHHIWLGNKKNQVPTSAAALSTALDDCAAFWNARFGCGLLCLERLIPPSTRLAVGQIGRESRFAVKRSICLSNDKKQEGKKGETGISKHGQTRLLCTKTRGPSYYLCMQRDVWFIRRVKLPKQTRALK